MTKQNIVFKAKGSEILRFCAIADVVESDILIEMGRHGLRFRAVDPSHVAMIEVDLGRITGNHKTTKFGIQVRDLKESAEKSEDITIQWAKDGKDIIIKADKWETTLKPLPEDTLYPPSVPDVNPLHAKTVHTSTIDFKLGCDRLSKMGDLCTFTLDRTLTGEVKTTYSSRRFDFSNSLNKRSHPTNLKKKTSSQYSLTYLSSLAKKLKVGKDATMLSWTVSKDNYPLTIRGKEGRMTWTYFLAPRMENN